MPEEAATCTFHYERVCQIRKARAWLPDSCTFHIELVYGVPDRDSAHARLVTGLMNFSYRTGVPDRDPEPYMCDTMYPLYNTVDTACISLWSRYRVDTIPDTIVK